MLRLSKVRRGTLARIENMMSTSLATSFGLVRCQRFLRLVCHSKSKLSNTCVSDTVLKNSWDRNILRLPTVIQTWGCWLEERTKPLSWKRRDKNLPHSLFQQELVNQRNVDNVGIKPVFDEISPTRRVKILSTARRRRFDKTVSPKKEIILSEDDSNWTPFSSTQP